MKYVLGGQHRVCVKDLLVVLPKIQFLSYWVTYHFGQPTIVLYSDHNPLTYITESSTKSARLLR